MNLTDKIAASTQLPSGLSEKIFTDDAFKNFGVRVKQNGTRSWVVQYSVNNQTRRKALGAVGIVPCAQARLEAKKIMAQVQLGTDPIAVQKDVRANERLAAAETLGAIVPRYLKLRELDLRPNTLVNVRQHLTQYAQPLHGLAVTSITLRIAADFLTAIEEGTASRKGGAKVHTLRTATRVKVRASLSTLWRWMLGEGLVTGNVWANTNKRKAVARDRWLDTDELADVWHSCAKIGDAGAIIRLLMLTGCRRDEIADLDWSEVKPDRIVIKAARVKTGGEHVVPLTAQMRSILAQLPTRSGYVFPAPSGKGGFCSFSHAKADLDERITARRKYAGAAELEAWTLHDLRRSVSTIMRKALGVEHFTVEACIGHCGAHGGVAGIYNQDDAFEPKRKAFVAWNDYLAKAVRGGDAGKLRIVA